MRPLRFGVHPGPQDEKRRRERLCEDGDGGRSDVATPVATTGWGHRRSRPPQGLCRQPWPHLTSGLWLQDCFKPQEVPRSPGA